MVVPHRAAMFTAKAIATIDVLSQGRATVGCGVGWMDEEFKAVGAPPFAERGKVTDEYLRAFKTLWTEDDPQFEGQYVRFSNVTFLPKPIQTRIRRCGSAAKAGRTATRGCAGRCVVSDRLESAVSARHDRPLHEGDRHAQDEAKRAGRDPATLELAYWANWYKEGQSATASDGQRQLFTGTDAEVARRYRRVPRARCASSPVQFRARSNLAESLAAMERFAANVLPLAGK
jgi:alkanesulfonate monooxygenase SsuD/methylene tetrahydromethanopterin reductase-like flavin-dependent oxidoreductase (luciferase family)